jgi:hypothetical protein
LLLEAAGNNDVRLIRSAPTGWQALLD